MLDFGSINEDYANDEVAGRLDGDNNKKIARFCA